MKTFEKYIQKYLTKLGYKQITKCKNDLVNTLKVYKCLAPSAETYVFETGEVHQLLNLGGTIPIVYKQETYNIPIKIWLLRDYPDTPPYCYILPTKDMELSVSPYLDHSGLVELPCTAEWDHCNTDLNTFLQIARITFSETPPVFSKPKVIPRKISKDEWESVWEEHFPDEEEKLLKNFFLKSASETCRSKLGEEFAKTRAEIDSLHSVNKELLEKQDDLVNLMKNIELKYSEIESSTDLLTESKELLDDINIVQSKEITKEDIDSLVEIPNAAHSQLLDLIVTDESINDCIYALGPTLENEQLSLEAYLKKVRELSRKQFHVRQRIIKMKQTTNAATN